MTAASSERVERLGPEWNHHRVLVFAGQFDTRIKTGEDYETRTLASLFTLEAGDQPKGAGLAFIPSSFNDFNGREHGVQREHGSYVALCGDVDTGDHPLEKIETAVRLFAGEAAWLVYSTAHARPGDMRWRIVLPLTDPIGFGDWHDAQNAMFDFLEENGIVMDRALDRAAQPVYLPCVPAVHAKSGEPLRGKDHAPLYYRRATTGTNAPGLDLTTGTVADGIASLRRAREADDRERERIRLEAVRRRANRPHAEGAPIIEEFNSGNSISDLLLRYNYQQSPRKGEDWRSPHQTGESYATRVVEDKWVSLSASDVGAKVGEPFAAGCYGDAYDLFVHYEHGGDHKSAFRALHGERKPAGRERPNPQAQAQTASGGGEPPRDDWRTRLQIGDRGPKKNLTNLMVFLRSLDGLGKEFRFNDLTGTVEWRGRALKDTDLIDIRLKIEAENFQPADKDLPAAVARVAEDNQYNPVVAYLDRLTWDGKPRVNKWLIDVFGAEDTEIMRAFGSMFLISAVARAIRPGCKVDTMLILEGEQGIKKSSAVGALFGHEYILNGLRTFHGDEAGISVQGRWAIDLGELSSMRKADVRDVKHFVALEMDNFRPKYGRNTIDRPRRCVFIGSTNEQGYLRDPTGGRRFWPVACSKVDLELLREQRDQLWAEAVLRWKAGERYWIDKGTDLEFEATKLQSDRYSEDVWAADIERFLDDAETRMRGCVLASEVLAKLGVKVEHQNREGEMRVTEHLTFLGWRKRRTERHGLNRNWWFPPGPPP